MIKSLFVKINNHPWSEKSLKIAIIGAMEEEVALIRQQLQNKEEKTIANIAFYTGEINNTKIILLKSGIGKVNAALATTLLIQLYKPDYVLNTGSAGGFYDQLEIGDIVISTEVRHSDADATVFGYEYGQIPQMPARYIPDAKLLTIAEKIAKKQTDVKVHKGLIASSDSFNSDPKRVEYIKSKMKNIYASDMEAAGIAQTCYQFGTPFIIVRSISDIAGKDAKLSYDQFLEKASQCSAEFVLRFIEELKKVG